jgi:hypothetical protein
VPNLVRQLDDRLGAQATVEVVVQESLGRVDEAVIGRLMHGVILPGV